MNFQSGTGLRFMATACVTAVLATVVCIHVSSQEGVGRHALVVGIGDYSGGSGWSKINGDRDAGLVVQMLERNGFLEEDIEVLLNARATKSNIRDAFAALCRQVGSGDIVYVHFSGHGQQVTDVNGDEEDGLDESFVPYDACKEYLQGVYEGENHIIDDELNVWLSELKNAVGGRGKILFVMDACHSGDSTRGEDCDTDWPVRGTEDVFEIPLADCPEWIDDIDAKRHGTDWFFIAACKSYQNNYEYKSEDGYYGRLTWALHKCLYPDMDFGKLVEELEAVYDIMPVTPKPQNLESFGPPGVKGKLFM